MTVSQSSGQQAPEDDTALLTAALNHAWTLYDARINRLYQVFNYFLVASAILATGYASAINGKHYGLAVIISLVGAGLTAIAFAVGVQEKLSADTAKPAVVALQCEISRKLGIDSIRILNPPRGWKIIIIFGMPGLMLASAVEIGSLVFALNH
jgi:hypothetical protein